MLPNTYFAKGAFISKGILLKSAIHYLAKWSVEWVPITILLVILAKGMNGKTFVLFLIVSLPMLFGLFSVGGDHMKGLRLLLPLFVILAYSIGAARQGMRLIPTKAAWVLAIGVIFFHLFLATVEWSLPIFPLKFGFKPRSHSAANGEIVGRFLEKSLQPDSLVAVNAGGAPPFFAPSLKFLDMLGLNDKVIARRKIERITTRYQRKPGHFKGDGNYVLSRNPDAIMIGLVWGELGENRKNLFLSGYELVMNPKFSELYTPFRIEIPLTEEQKKWPEAARHLEKGQYFIVIWLKNDFQKVEQLRQIGERLCPSIIVSFLKMPKIPVGILA